MTVDERPAVIAAKIAANPTHQRWLSVVATTIDAPPATPGGAVAFALLVLLALLAVATISG